MILRKPCRTRAWSSAVESMPPETPTQQAPGAGDAGEREIAALPGSGFGDFFGTEMAPEGFRDEDAAVGLPVGLEQGNVDAGQRGAGAVEGVAEAVFAVGILEPEVQPAGLEILEIRAARDLEIGVLAGRPDLDVVGFRAAEAEVAGAKLDDAVMEAEELEDFLGIRR